MFHISKAGPIVHTAPDFPCLPFLCCIRALTSSAAPRQCPQKQAPYNSQYLCHRLSAAQGEVRDGCHPIDDLFLGGPMGNLEHWTGEYKEEKLQSPLPFTVTSTTKDRLTREN